MDIKPLFDDIKVYDYSEPIKRLTNRHKYYESILLLCNDFCSYKERLDYFDKIPQNMRDEIMIKYMSCRKHVITSILWPVSMKEYDNIIKEINNEYYIYYVKQINLDPLALQNLIAEIYGLSDPNEITEHYEKLKNSNFIEYNSKMAIVIYEPKEHKIKLSNDSKIYTTTSFLDSITIAQLLLNDNNISLLSNMLVKDNKSDTNNSFLKSSKLLIDKFASWCYENMDQIDINDICLVGGSTLFIHKIRKITKVYFVMNNDHSHAETKETMAINFQTKETKDKDITLLDNRHVKLHDITIQDLIYDPDNFYYYKGLKIIDTEPEILRKIARQKYRDIADIIMLYFVQREILGYHVYLDKNLKLYYNDVHKIKRRSIINEEANEMKKYIDLYYDKIYSSKISIQIFKSLLL
jgi:hypothetical protein